MDSHDVEEGWLCVRLAVDLPWTHRYVLLSRDDAVLTLRADPSNNHPESSWQLGPDHACFPAADVCPGLFTFELRSRETTTNPPLLLGTPSLAEMRSWLGVLQELCAPALSRATPAGDDDVGWAAPASASAPPDGRVRWLLAEHGWCGEAAAADAVSYTHMTLPTNREV